MTMERWIIGQTKAGHDAAAAIGKTLLEQFGDIPLDQAADIKPSRPLQYVNLEIPTVSEEIYNKTREALAKEGLVYIVAIKPLSMGQLATDEATSSHFSFVNPSENMRSIVPPQMEIAFDPKNIRIENSNSKSTDAQIEITRDEEAKLKDELPIDVRDAISMTMPNASTLAQADFDYQVKSGNPLFPDFFVRTNDKTVSGGVADVGRDVPSGRLRVDDWHRGHGHGIVFAARVVVLPRKLGEPVE